jgi:hypothetical protein
MRILNWGYFIQNLLMEKGNDNEILFAGLKRFVNIGYIIILSVKLNNPVAVKHGVVFLRIEDYCIIKEITRILEMNAFYIK